MASSPSDSHGDPFADNLSRLPYSEPFNPPAPSAPPPSRPSSATSFAPNQPRWSFLDSAEPDLTLSVYSHEPEGEERTGAGGLFPAGKEEQGGMSWSYAAETVGHERDRSSDEDDAGRRSTSGRSGSEEEGMMRDDSPWTTPEVSQGEFSHVGGNGQVSLTVPVKDDLAASRSGSFLPVPESATNGLNRSNGSSPDSFVDPYMAASSAPPPPSAPPPTAPAPHSSPPASPSFPFPPPSLAAPPPHLFGSTPSPPRIDLRGRPLPSAPPSTDPFAAYRSEHPYAAAGKSPKMRALGSFRSLTMPFGGGGGRGASAEEDMTTSSFASVGTSNGGGGSTTGYWDTSLSLNVSGVIPTSPLPLPLTSTPTHPPPPLLRSHTAPSPGEVPMAMPSPPVPAATPAYPTYSRPPHTVVDFPPLPLTSSTSAPSGLSSHSTFPPQHAVVPISSSPTDSSPLPAVERRASALALRRSVTRPPPAALLLVQPPSSPHTPPLATAETSTTATTGSSPSSSAKSALRTINRSPDGFYRPPPSPSSTSLLPPPSPLSARRPTSLYGALPLPLSPSARLSASPELAFPLPPPSATTADTASPSAAYNPLNPFSGHQRAGTGGSGYTATSGFSEGERARATPSFVSVFVPPLAQGGRQQGRSPFDDSSDRAEDEEEEEPGLGFGMGEIPIYPPQAFQHRAGAESLSSAVAFGLDSPRRRTATKLVKPSQQHDRDEHDEQERKEGEEKKRRTEAWLNGVVGATSSSSLPRVGGGATGLDRSPSARMRRAVVAAKGAVGWSIRGEKEKLESVDGHGRRTAQGRKKGLKGWWSRRSTRMKYRLAFALVALLILLVALPLGLSHRSSAAPLAAGDCTCLNGGRPSLSSDGKGCACECKEGLGGTGCALNATCVDVGGGTGGRNWVAQGMVEVAEQASELWAPEVDIVRLGEVLSTYILPNATSGSTSSSSSTPPSCAAHLSLLTLPSLPISLYPTRLSWTQSALLYTLSLTESNSSLSSLRTFASGLSFSPYGDSPATKPNSNYQAIVGGYMWDLSVMERVALNVGWEKTVSPPDEAGARIDAAGEKVRDAVEKVAANAVAASKQRTKALQHYWVDTLGLQADDLDIFRSRVQQAEVVVPFDATTSGIFNTPTSAGGPFPPAIGCMGGLSSEMVERVNEVEQGAFGLEEIQAGQTGNATCVDRPIYGLLNLLNLRLPFPSSDSRSSSLSQQSLVLSSSTTVTSRISLHAGETLSGGSSASSPPPTLSAPTTIERFGLRSNLDHVLLDYLLLLPSIAVAKALVTYVLSSSTTPPSSASDLFTASNSLADIPQLEVQIWGGLQRSDIAFARSGLSSSPSSASNLFFGSSSASSLRSWALSSSPPLSRIEWAQNAESAQVMHDTSPLGGNSAFEGVWAAAAKGGTTTAGRVWQQLQKAGLAG